MPDRIIHASARASETLDRLSDGAERLFWRLTTVADDYGRFRADPRILKAECFPLKIDTLPTETIATWFAELCDGPDPLVQSYEADGKAYGVFVKWFERQRRRDSKPKHPTPPEIAPLAAATVAESSPVAATSPESPPPPADRASLPQVGDIGGEVPPSAATSGDSPLARAPSGSRESRGGSAAAVRRGGRPPGFAFDEWSRPIADCWREHAGSYPEEIPFHRFVDPLRGRVPQASVVAAVRGYFAREDPRFVDFDTFAGKWKLYAPADARGPTTRTGPGDETLRVQLAAIEAAKAVPA